MTNVDEVEHGRSAATASGGPEDSGQSWLIRAGPGLLLGFGLIAMAAAMLLAARSGVNVPVSKQVSFGPFDVLLVYSTPTPQLALTKAWRVAPILPSTVNAGRT